MSTRSHLDNNIHTLGRRQGSAAEIVAAGLTAEVILAISEPYLSGGVTTLEA